MESTGERNRAWADGILRRVDPAFRHRWEVYEGAVANALDRNTVWIDCGCGDNTMVHDLSRLAKQAVGVDLLDPGRRVPDFARADIRRLPFRSESADLVTLRFVVEHFREVDPYMSEIARVLRPGGRVIILTTNALSPLIAIPRLLLPFPLKHRILTTLFRVDSGDVFPTYHRLNTPGRFRGGVGPLALRRLDLLSDINYVRRWIFAILLAWHRITMPAPLRRFRMNLLAVLEKRDAQRTTATLPVRDPSAASIRKK